MTSRYINYDEIISLPTDETPPSSVEIEIVNQIFKQNKGIIHSILNELKEPLLVAILFLLLSLPYTTNIIISILPVTQNSLIFLQIAKAIAIMILFWILKHFNLARVNN